MAISILNFPYVIWWRLRAATYRTYVCGQSEAPPIVVTSRHNIFPKAVRRSSKLCDIVNQAGRPSAYNHGNPRPSQPAHGRALRPSIVGCDSRGPRQTCRAIEPPKGRKMSDRRYRRTEHCTRIDKARPMQKRVRFLNRFIGYIVLQWHQPYSLPHKCQKDHPHELLLERSYTQEPEPVGSALLLPAFQSVHVRSLWPVRYVRCGASL
jgi:hypothetical protein